jgi:hypothetical protein
MTVTLMRRGSRDRPSMVGQAAKGFLSGPYLISGGHTQSLGTEVI